MLVIEACYWRWWGWNAVLCRPPPPPLEEGLEGAMKGEYCMKEGFGEGLLREDVVKSLKEKAL